MDKISGSLRLFWRKDRRDIVWRAQNHSPIKRHADNRGLSFIDLPHDSEGNYGGGKMKITMPDQTLDNEQANQICIQLLLGISLHVGIQPLKIKQILESAGMKIKIEPEENEKG